MKPIAGEISRVTDADTLREIGNHIVVGKSFAFVRPEAFKSEHLGWLRHVFALAPKKTLVVPLLGVAPIQLPGATLEPRNLASLCLRSLTSDKLVYQVGIDQVHILAFEPQYAGRKRVVQTLANGSEYSSQDVELGANGQAQIILRDLPAGDYSVAFQDETEDEQHCRFTVAEYKLVPLVATLLTKEFHQNGTLKATLRVDTFGMPVEGDVRVDVVDGDQRTSSVVATCEKGILNVRVTLDGVGPHQLALQLGADASKTASVAIVGSRVTERKQTLFNPLGTELLGALLPGENTTEIRGIYLSEGATRCTPVALAGIEDKAAILEIRSDMDNLTVCVADPHHPKPSTNAIDITSAKHPALADTDAGRNYVIAEKLFLSGQITEALAIFQEWCGNDTTAAHPNFQYYVGCCHARLGNVPQALQALKLAIGHGWTDYAHMDSDDDLANLHGVPEFESMRNGGVRTFAHGTVTAGQTIEVQTCSPVSIIAIGGLLDGMPWEGWTAAVTPPSQGEPALHLDDKYEPGKQATFKVTDVPEGASVYLVIKDSRLISADTPTSRLASCIKSYVKKAGAPLIVGFPPGVTLKQLSPAPPKARSPWDDGQITTGVFMALGVPENQSGSWGAPIPAGGAFRQEPAAAPFNRLDARASVAPPTSPANPLIRELTRQRGASADALSEMAALSHWQVQGTRSTELLLRSHEAPPMPAPGQELTIRQETVPEVLFAGFATVSGSTAEVCIHLPDILADYTIEVFVARRYDWTTVVRHFRTNRDSLIDLMLPAFAAEDDKITARLTARTTSEDVSISLTHDGELIPLTDAQGRSFSEAKLTTLQMQEFTFRARPGKYEAKMLSPAGRVLAAQTRSVHEPGKLRYQAKTLRIIEPGDTLSLSDIPGARKLALMPGIDADFKVMVRATADYSHCCCEQTAAKIVAGCAMYMFMGESDERQKLEAEAVIVAGIKREQTMWIKGKGLLSYPPDGNGGGEPVEWLNRAAVQHLTSLNDLSAYGQRHPLGQRLAEALSLGLSIAEDVAKAAKLEMPPKECRSYEDAYNIARHPGSDATLKDLALSFVREHLRPDGTLSKEDATRSNNVQYYGMAVTQRLHQAKAACVLLHSKNYEDLRAAVKLANAVIKDINAAGRLYSTADSAAAIALLAALRESVVGGKGQVEINGKPYSANEALDLQEEIKTIKGLEGFITAQVTRTVEEDWSKFASSADLKVSLESNGRVAKQFSPGEQIDLKVSIDSGYKEGDLLWLCLPDAIARIFGGAQVKMFSVDFAGRSEVVIPLVATSSTTALDGAIAPQKLAVCLRNMFNEERAGNPGLLPITVRPA